MNQKESIFKNAYFGKGYKTRDDRKALFSRKDGDTFDLETEDSYNPVRSDGSFLYTKEGYESNNDIVSDGKKKSTRKNLMNLLILKLVKNRMSLIAALMLFFHY